jgi:hypothetical protein
MCFSLTRQQSNSIFLREKGDEGGISWAIDPTRRCIATRSTEIFHFVDDAEYLILEQIQLAEEKEMRA